MSTSENNRYKGENNQSPPEQREEECDHHFQRFEEVLSDNSRLLELRIETTISSGALIEPKETINVLGSAKLKSGTILKFDYIETRRIGVDQTISRFFTDAIGKLKTKAAKDGIKITGGIMETGGGHHDYRGD